MNPTPNPAVPRMNNALRIAELKNLRTTIENWAQFLVNQFDPSVELSDTIRSLKAARMDSGCLFGQTNEKDLNRERDESLSEETTTKPE